MDEVALGRVSRRRAAFLVGAVHRVRRLVGEMTVRDAVVLRARFDVDIFAGEVPIEVALGDQIVAASNPN